MESFLYGLLEVVITIAVIIGIWYVWHIIKLRLAKRYCTVLDEAQFTKGMRKAQVIDLRESKNFDGGHILGARNMPYSTFRNFYSELRPDLPVYLYDQGSSMSLKAAKFLHKKGFRHIAVLKGGYQGWDGKTKKG